MFIKSTDKLDDVKNLIDMLFPYLMDEEIPFKFATKKRIESDNKEQSRKIFTIYNPTGNDFEKLVDKITELSKNYKGGESVPPPSKYQKINPNVYVRNDRDDKGEYIPADISKYENVYKDQEERQKEEELKNNGFSLMSNKHFEGKTHSLETRKNISEKVKTL
jgi:hypothetical protein